MGIKEAWNSHKEKQQLAKIENAKWEKISKDFLVSQEYKKIRIGKQDVDFSILAGAEIIEKDKTVTQTFGNNKTKTKSKKHIAPVKGLVGGALFGPVGAIVGGTSGKTTTKGKTRVNTSTIDIEYCKELSVKITTNDINNPIITYKIITFQTNKDGMLYKKSYGSAEKCVAIINTIASNNK